MPAHWRGSEVRGVLHFDSFVPGGVRFLVFLLRGGARMLT